MTGKLAVGILGCADIAARMFIPALLSSKNFTLHAVSSRAADKAVAFAQRFSCKAVAGYDKLLEEPVDVIYIPLPTGLHYEWAIKCLEAGKHVIIEKSLANSYTEVEQIIKLAKSKNLLVFENFQFQFHSQHIHIKSLLEKKEIGEIRSFRSSFGFPPFPDKKNIRYTKALGGGALLDSGAYTLKATSFILGAGCKIQAASLGYQKDFEVDILGAGQLISPGNIVSQVSFGFDNYYQCNFEIWGSMGKIVSERAFTAGPTVMPKVILERQNEYHEFLLNADNCFLKMLNEVYRKITERDFESEYMACLEQARLIDEFKQLCYA